MEEVRQPTVSVTGLMDYLVSPKHYKAFHIDKLREPSTAMLEGSAFHLAVLEPDKFKSDVYVDMTVPPGKRYLESVNDLKKFLLENNSLANGKKEDLILEARKIICDNQVSDVLVVGDLEALYDRKIRVTQSGYDKVLRMRDSVLANPFVKTHYGSGQYEVPIQAEIDGVIVRGRMDWMFFLKIVHPKTGELMFEGNAIMDLKSARSARYHEFSGAVARSNYHVQAWLYYEMVRRVFKTDAVYAWIVCESVQPHICELYSADFGTLELGEKLARTGLAKFKEDFKNNSWSGYSNGQMINLGVPHWAFNIDEGDWNDVR